MGQLSWSFKAASNLQAIHQYVAEDSGSSFYATRFVRGLIKATRKLESFPNCGRLVPELESHGFREVIHKGYRIIYRVRESNDDLEVLAVVHGARDLLGALQEGWSQTRGC